jgi:hypothetical protein
MRINGFPPCEDLRIPKICLTSTLGNEKCLTLLLRVSNAKKRGNLSLSLREIHIPTYDLNLFLGFPNKIFKTSWMVFSVKNFCPNFQPIPQNTVAGSSL